MGGTAWSDDHYRDRVSHRAATGKATFAYSAATSAKPAHARTAHDTLNPRGVKVRESRDSDAHPNSQAIAVLFDVTGSMGQVPTMLQANLPKLMGLLLRKNYLADPQILVGGIGDATCDTVPLQVGQFESGIEIENDLTNLYLEGGGGGQKTESYELAMWFMARHTAMDCLEKRNKKGYLFLIGDEMPYPSLKPGEVEKIIGDTLTEPMAVESLAAELQQKFDVYFIVPNLTSYYEDESIWKRWRGLFGQHVLRLEDPASICELIGSTIGLAEGADLDSLAADLADVGTSAIAVGAIRNALATVSSAKADAGMSVRLPDSGAPAGLATL